MTGLSSRSPGLAKSALNATAMAKQIVADSHGFGASRPARRAKMTRTLAIVQSCAARQVQPIDSKPKTFRREAEDPSRLTSVVATAVAAREIKVAYRVALDRGVSKRAARANPCNPSQYVGSETTVAIMAHVSAVLSSEVAKSM